MRLILCQLLRLLLFSPILKAVFSPCLSFIRCAKAFKFNQVPFVYFCFYFHYSGRWVIKDLAVIYVGECSMFSSRSFIVSGLTCRYLFHFEFIFVFSSVAQSCPTLCDPMDCSMPGFPVHHQLLELTQIHVHQASDAIQPSYPLPSPSPPTFNLSQHQGLFK